MTIKENIREFWSDLSFPGKAFLAAIVFVVLALMISGWISSISSGIEVRKLEREAVHAKAQAEEALKLAVKIGRDIKEKEKQLAEIEEKRNAKQSEADAAKQKSNDARRDYDRSVNRPRTDNPSTDQLCAELAELGYPCA